MKKSIAAILILVGLGSDAAAQDNVTAITYQVSVPTSDLETYIGKTSWIGWGIEGRRFANPMSNFTVGFAFAWHVFDDRLFGTTEFDRGAITGTQRRYINSVPFLLTGDYYLNRNNGVKPFIGVGAGAFYVVKDFDIGVWTEELSHWGFGLEGEAGFQFPLGEVEGIAALRYYYAFSVEETLSGEKNDLSYATAVIGLAYIRW
jgi:opacity protein-like surface antigen